MKTKHLLTALALPAVFAACTNEELPVENIVKEDLGTRPVVEDVTFSFGDAQSRAEIANWGTINFEAGDKVGVALIDEVEAPDATDPINRYNLLEKNINTNYIFTANASGEFSSEAAMVEGNYLFYYPYNTQRTRKQIVTNLPKEQALTALEDGTYSSYPSVLAKSEETGAPIAVAYDFLSAADAGNALNATLKQIYATPLITIQNGCTKVVEGEPVAQPITIKQISLTYGNGGEFVLSAPLKFSDDKSTAYDEAKSGNNSLVSNLFNETISTTLANAGVTKGSWISEIKGRSTSDLLGGTAITKSTEIILTLAEPVTVEAEGSFSFYAVIPAEDYSTNLLSATVMNAEGLSEKITFAAATLSAGQRYPEEEINDDNTLNNDIKGMSLTATVEEFDAIEGVLVSSVDELINAVKNFTYPSTATTAEKVLKVRVSGNAVINKRVADFLKLTTTKATSIEFVNDVTIDGTGVVLDPAKPIIFDTKATAVSGAALTLKSDNVSGNLVIATGATATYEDSALSAIENNGTLTVKGNASANIQNNGVMNVTASVELTGVVKNGKYVSDSNYGGVAAELNVSAQKKLKVSNFTNAPGATVNNLGTIEGTFANKGEIVNGSETNIVAKLDITSNDYVATKYTGSIKNYAKATVTEMNGDVEMMSVNAYLNAIGGAGTIDNDELAEVHRGSRDMVVTYTVSGVQTNETIDPAVLKTNSISKVIFDGVTLKLNADLDLSAFDVYVKSNSSVNSLKGAQAKLTLYVKSKAVAADVTFTANAGTSIKVGAPASSEEE